MDIKINLNKVAQEVAQKEGGKVNLNIGEIKEVISLTLKNLAKYEDDLILEAVKRYKD